MARNSRVLPISEESNEEMTVVIFKLKGQSSTLQKGFDAINTAFAAFGNSALPTAAIRRIGTNGSGSKTTAAVLTNDTDEQSDEDVIEEEADVIEVPKASGKARQPHKYKFVDDFDLNQSEKPWKVFSAEKAPKSDSEST